ncbi:MAG: PHP domain-containing protein [Ruminococcaceae bacterium]|nr:PHP domain-containing protein [Oscillospiraceae bacterium]
MNLYYYDLHIHSCLSPCADDDMTPNNIAGMAAIKGLHILALTDHNSCKNCPAFFAACKKQGIVPIAGMELSTAEDIHLVCLFPTLEQALACDKELGIHLLPIQNKKEIFGNQLVLDEKDEIIGEEGTLLISATDLPIDEAIRFAEGFGAHVHPAHIDRESNGILAILGDIPQEYGFDCLEFNNPNSMKSIFERFPRLSEAKALVCSDAHHLWDINEAEHSILLEDEPYSSSLVRSRLFDYLQSL